MADRRCRERHDVAHLPLLLAVRCPLAVDSDIAPDLACTFGRDRVCERCRPQQQICRTAAIAAGLAAATAALFALKPLAQRWFVGQITSCWATLRRFGRGQPTWLD